MSDLYIVLKNLPWLTGSVIIYIVQHCEMCAFVCAGQVSGGAILQQSGGRAGCEGEGGRASGRGRSETSGQSGPAQRDLHQSDQPAEQQLSSKEAVLKVSQTNVLMKDMGNILSRA